MLKKLATATAAMLLALMPLTATQVQAATGTNVIANPSVETSTNGTTPDGWGQSTWGTNTSTFSYENTGHTGSRSVKVQTTAYTDGAANWYFTPGTAVTAGQSYVFETWYQSDVATQAGVEVTINGSATPTYINLGTVPAAATWTKYSATFTAPVNAASAVAFQLLAGVGYLQTDDYSLASYTADPLTRPIVSVTFDDGWANQYINGRQVLKDNGIKSTFYLISDPLQNGDGVEYMNATQAKDLYADGHEIAGHTVHHCSLTGSALNAGSAECPTPMTTQDITNEMVNSKATIQTLTGAPVTNFAYPYGEYNAETIAIGQQAGYTSQRTVEAGTNTKDNLDLNKLKGFEVDANTTVDQVKAWVDTAIAQKSWVVLFYHEVADTPVAADDAQYTTKIADFVAEMQYIHSRSADIDSMTVAQAIAAIKGTVVTPPATKPGDVNGDNVVDALDLSTLLSNWNQAGKTVAQGNLNGDATVDALDLSTLLANWSK